LDPNVENLSATESFYGIAKSAARAGSCSPMTLRYGKRDAFTQYITDLVTELQTLAQCGNQMIKGVLSSNNRAASAVISPPRYRSPFRSDDARLDSLKASAWQLFENIISLKKWAVTGPSCLFVLTNELLTVVEYLNTANAQNSLEHVFNSQQSFSKAFDIAASGSSSHFKPLSGPSFAGQHLAWYEDVSETFARNLKDFYINDAEKYRNKIADVYGVDTPGLK
ncbi:MAG: hypothetical protein Q9180_006574, partial [Flavoplaca navasiana]